MSNAILALKIPGMTLFLRKLIYLGTVAHISSAHTALSEENAIGDYLFTMGINGFLKLSSASVRDRYYGKFDYRDMIEVLR